MKELVVAAILAAQSWTAIAWAEEDAPPPSVVTPGDGMSIDAVPLGTAITYQGRLDRNGTPVSGNCNLIFKLFDAASGGLQVGCTVTLSNQLLTEGLFTGALDFCAGAFNGQARWLEIQVQGPGDPGHTLLTPRQAISPAPYALHALNGAGSLALPFAGSTSSPAGQGFRVDNTASTGTGVGVYGSSQSSNSSSVGVAGAATAGRGVTGASGIGIGVEGTSTSGMGIRGYSSSAAGVYGESVSSAGVWGKGGATSSGVYGESPMRGVFGESSAGTGVWGKSTSSAGIYGESASSAGVWGKGGATSSGVYGESPMRGVFGESSAGTGVWGKSTSNAGVYGESASSAGVWGKGGVTSSGVYGESPLRGVFGESTAGTGVWGKSTSSAGVYGESVSSAAVWGKATQASGLGGYFQNTAAGGVSLLVDGRAQVKTLEILGGADIVEGFETGNEVLEPGTVVVIDEHRPGELCASAQAYDSRVAGVVSGAGGVVPGLRLGQDHVLDGETSVAMTGRVYVRCSVQSGRIRPGDLLTTSDRGGHAMRASDATRSNGAILGKAMTSLDAGTGLVLVLVNLQ